MTVEELENIIKHSEVSRVQFKERIDDNYKIGTEMVAFSNSLGGNILIGVRDKTGDMNPLSPDELRETNNSLSNIATQNVEPRIGIETDTVNVEGGSILVDRKSTRLNSSHRT